MMLRRRTVVVLLAVASLREPSAVGAAGEVVPALPLTKRDVDARDGVVHVLQRNGGLLLRIETNGPDEPAAAERIDVWLAAPEPPKLPPIGWGHQFGEETLDTEDGCAAMRSTWTDKTDADVQASCRRWFRAQVAHRESLTKLFVRHWEATAAGIVETEATPTLDGLAPAVRKTIAALAPEGRPTITRPDDRHFEILIPWPAFPPMRSLDLEEVALRVDVTRTAPPGARSSTSDVVAAGRTDVALRETLSAVRLPAPRHYFITPCRYQPGAAVIGYGPSRASNAPSESAVVYYRPTAGLDLRSVVVLENTAAGYQYLPDDDARSPVVAVADFSVVSIGKGRFLCGPQLAYADGDGVVRAEYAPYADVRPLTKAIGADRYLVRYGPYAAFSYYGSGQCGACPRVELGVFLLDVRRRSLTPAFQYLDVVDSAMEDVDLRVAPDWRTITFFHTAMDENYVDDGPWSASMHCLRDTKYVECGHRDGVPEPKPRTISYPQ